VDIEYLVCSTACDCRSTSDACNSAKHLVLHIMKDPPARGFGSSSLSPSSSIRTLMHVSVSPGASRSGPPSTVGLHVQTWSLGWFLNKELLISIGPKQAPSSITLEQKLQDLCETNFRYDRISQSVANARCTLLNCFGLLVVRGQGFHWDTSLAALSFEICPASAAIHRSKHGSH